MCFVVHVQTTSRRGKTTTRLNYHNSDEHYDTMLHVTVTSKHRG